MSQLKIEDLSFYETEILNDSHIQGGGSFTRQTSLEISFGNVIPDTLLTDLTVLDQAPDGFSLEKELTDQLGFKYQIVTKKTDTGTVFAAVSTGNNGKSSSAFASATSI